MTVPAELLRTIQDGAQRAASEGRICEHVGPFVATVHPTSDMIWLNHVVPADVPSQRITADEIDHLRAFYRKHHRILRFEYIEELWPELAADLERCGLTMQARLPFMVCDRAGFRPATVPGVRLERLTVNSPEQDLVDFVITGKVAFGQTPTSAEPHEIEELAEKVKRGTCLHVLARVASAPAGIGVVLRLSSELAGIGTRPEFRRRGVGSAVCSQLLSDHFAAGNPVAWLSAGNDAAVGLYERVGFHHAGCQLNYMDPLPGKDGA